MNYKYLISFILLHSFQTSFAQFNMVNVNAVTGTANISIPISTVNNGSLSVPISLNYSGTGVKVKDVENNGGIGWQVSGGGEISRELRGLPDDVKKDNSGNNRLGWLYNTNGSLINGLSIANNGTPNCTNETTDTTNIHNDFSNLSDTEPDIFSIDAPGLSCKFVFDNAHHIKTIPYQDLKITYTTNATTGVITGFTVINDKGIRYNFSSGSNSVRQTTNVAGTSTVSESNIIYYKNEYAQFKYGISYSGSWMLNTIIDPNGNYIFFTYIPGLEQDSETPLELYIGSTTKTVLYWTKDTTNPYVLASISGANSTATFMYLNNYRTSIPMIGSISVNGVNYILNYSAVGTAGVNYNRYFLRNISTDQCNIPFKYNFTYYGESLTSGIYSTTLTDSTSKSIDFWGYQNSGHANTNLAPSLLINPSNALYQRYQAYTDGNSRADYTYSVSGSDRRADTTVVMTGALRQLSYFNNGATTLTYESNDYYDPTAGVTVKGGGIRIKRVTVYDGIDSTKNIVRNYSYIDPSTNLTSGKAVTLPVYAFTGPYTGSGTTASKWALSTVRSELDLSPDDHSVLYSSVTLTQTGAGKIWYEYFLPATNYDASAIPACGGCTTSDWNPNHVNVAGPGCFAAGFMSNDITTYPFAPMTNYDFERGLIKKITNYNDANAEVSETVYAYTRTGAPEVTTGFKFDNASSVKSYLKYNIYTSASELNQQVINKVFDLGSTTLSQQTSVTYSYGSAYHKQPTQIQTTKSDGTTENNNIIYSKDYLITTMSDDHVTALYNLQQQNINVPVENYTQVVKAGVSKIITAALVKFKPFIFPSDTLYLPAQTLRFFDQNGVSSTSFAPAFISSGLFVNDSKYIVQENDLIYDRYGFLQTKNDNRKHVQTVLADIGRHLPMVVAANTSADEIGYYSYNGSIEISSFTKTNSTINPVAGRPVQASTTLSLESGGAFTHTITKNLNAINYIFSIWLKPSVTGSINLVLTGSDLVPHTYSLSFSSTGGDWKYYEIKVPVAALSSVFNAVFTNMAVSGVPIDDVLFYPENAEVISYDYDRVTQVKIAETNTNGVANYFVSDQLGRLDLVYDRDKQVVQRKSYNFLDSYGPFLSPAFSADDYGTANTTTIINFSPATNYNTCQFTGITYTWNFGDGTTPIVASTNTAQTHQYSSTGFYTVTETVYAPGYGTKSVSDTLTIHAPPPPVIPVLYVNNSTAGGLLNTVKFSQGGVLRYTFTGSTLAAGTTMIPAGNYNVTVKGSGTIGSVTLDAVNSLNCQDTHLPTGIYPIVVVNLVNGNSLTITLNDTPCM